AKLFAEAVEAIEIGPVEGVRASGASGLQEVIYGVIPQVLPLWISYSLYRFESNVRSATVVGMVGAGGIGVTLWEAIRGFQLAQTCAILLISIVAVSVIDIMSQRLRKHSICFIHTQIKRWSTRAAVYERGSRPEYCMTNSTFPSVAPTTQRQRWMQILSRAGASLEAHSVALRAHGHRYVRTPETGMVMVRGRMGGD